MSNLTHEMRRTLEAWAKPSAVAMIAAPYDRAAIAAALADLDACRAALRPVATKLVGWQDGPPVRQLLARTVCLSPAEADAVLAADREETP